MERRHRAICAGDWKIDGQSSIQVILVALPGVDTDAVEAELDKQLMELPRLKAVRSAFNHSAIVHAADRAEAAAFSNTYVSHCALLLLRTGRALICAPC